MSTFQEHPLGTQVSSCSTRRKERGHRMCRQGSSLSILLTMLFLLPLGLFAAGPDGAAGPHTPSSIISDVKSRGAKAVVDSLYEDERVWEGVIEKISSGDKAWLHVAVALRAGSDAGTSIMLIASVSAALEHNPTTVLEFVVPAFNLSEVCSAPDVDLGYYDSNELAVKAVDLRITKIKSMAPGPLRTVATRCLNYLKETKRNLKTRDFD